MRIIILLSLRILFVSKMTHGQTIQSFNFNDKVKLIGKYQLFRKIPMMVGRSLSQV